MLLRRKPIAARLALAAMALNALWPLLAGAKPNIPSLPSEICSASGLVHGDGPAQPLDDSYSPSHCKFCPPGVERGLALLTTTTAALSGAEPGRGPAPAIPAESWHPAALDPGAPPRAPTPRTSDPSGFSGRF
jgi:hypothetical protein